MKNFDYTKKCCFSGYRPSKFPFRLNTDDIDFQILQSRLFKTLNTLIEDDCRVFYCGMAMGFDIIAAEAVLKIKNNFNDIKLFCAVPFENQEDKFPTEWKKRYNNIINCCDEVILLSKTYHNGCYQKRNCFMVDSSDYVITWYDGKNGGTRNTLKYAEKLKRYIINLNTNYLDEFNNSQLSMGL